MDEPELEEVKEELKKELNFNLEDYTEIDGGANNKLFRLVSSNGDKLLLKVYHYDDRNRLQREFKALQFLHSYDFHFIPKAYFKNEQYNFAIYSFEQGEMKSNNDITSHDINVMAEFMAKLHRFKKSEVPTDFPSAVLACFSLQDYVNNIHFRLKKFTDHTNSHDIHNKIKQFNQQRDIKQVIHTLTTKAIEHMNKQDLEKNISIDQQRLSPVDFGPHNMLFKDNGDIVFIDFEYFGWDDPSREIADFVNHDQTNDVSIENKKLYIETYLKATNATGEFTRRLEMVIKLVAIEWLTIHLYAMTPDKTKSRQFADVNFNIENYLDDQIAKFNKRMSELIY